MDRRSGSFLSSVSSFAVTNDDLDIHTYAILSRVISFLDFVSVSRLVLYWFVVRNGGLLDCEIVILVRFSLRLFLRTCG